MKVRFSPNFYRQYKKADVRIQNSTDEKQSIDITNDYRAHYKEIKEGTETVAYFVCLGTHEELYGNSN